MHLDELIAKHQLDFVNSIPTWSSIITKGFNMGYHGIYTVVVYYNKAMFDEAGLSIRSRIGLGMILSKLQKLTKDKTTME